MHESLKLQPACLLHSRSAPLCATARHLQNDLFTRYLLVISYDILWPLVTRFKGLVLITAIHQPFHRHSYGHRPPKVQASAGWQIERSLWHWIGRPWTSTCQPAESAARPVSKGALRQSSPLRSKPLVLKTYQFRYGQIIEFNLCFWRRTHLTHFEKAFGWELLFGSYGAMVASRPLPAGG